MSDIIYDSSVKSLLENIELLPSYHNFDYNGQFDLSRGLILVYNRPLKNQSVLATIDRLLDLKENGHRVYISDGNPDKLSILIESIPLSIEYTDIVIDDVRPTMMIILNSDRALTGNERHLLSCVALSFNGLGLSPEPIKLSQLDIDNIESAIETFINRLN